MTPKRLPADLSAWPKDPIAVLGVRRGADRGAVRRAYTALLREFNPEHFPEHFRRIREAYELVLQQVDWNEAMQARQQGDSQEEAPLDFDPEEEDESSGQPDNAPAAPLDKPIARNGFNPTASMARWHDDLDALWNRAVAKDDLAYRALVEIEARFSGRRDLCLRLYWLLVAWPELDAKRTSCDWLVRGLRMGGLSGPLAELYRRELDDHPDEGLSDRCAELLEAKAEPAPLADMVEARWRALGRLDEMELIPEDLERLRARLNPAAEEVWGRLVLAGVNEMCWSVFPEIHAQAHAYWKELDELPHLHTPLRYALDRTETIRSVAAGWNLLRGTAGVPEELLQLVRLSVFRPAEEVAPVGLDLLRRLLTNDGRLLALFDRIHKKNAGVVAQIAQVIAVCGGREAIQSPDDAGQLRAMAQLEVESRYRASYEDLRPSLLDFCVREQVSPETLVRMPNIVLARPESINLALVRRITADAPLQLVYLAHRAISESAF